MSNTIGLFIILQVESLTIVNVNGKHCSFEVKLVKNNVYLRPNMIESLTLKVPVTAIDALRHFETG